MRARDGVERLRLVCTALSACTLLGISLSSASAQSLPLQSPTSAPQPATASSASSRDLPQVGVAAAVQGQVELRSKNAVGRVIQSGKPIYLGDVVTTGPAGRLQILLLDETVFTIGPNSAVLIDKFVYDPATQDGEVSAQIIKGVFRFVTGKIAHKKPENMNVTLPAGTIGVRGTMVAGETDGVRSTVALLGPGPENRVGARIGRIEVGNEVRGSVHSVLVDRPGFGTMIEGPDVPPTPPAPLPAAVLDSLNQALSGPLTDQGQSDQPTAPRPEGDEPPQEAHRPPPQPHQQPPTVEQLHAMADAGLITPDQLTQMLTDLEAWESGDEATRQALMETYSADDPVMPESTLGDDLTYDPSTDEYHEYDVFDPNAVLESYDTQTNTAAQDTADHMAAMLESVSTKAELGSVETGEFHFSAMGPFLQSLKDGLAANHPGEMGIVLNINFGSKTIGGGGSHLNVNTSGGGGNIAYDMPIGATSFNSGPGDLAIYHQTSGSLTGDFAILNSATLIGGVANVHAVFDDGGMRFGEGHINGIPREDGLQ